MGKIVKYCAACEESFAEKFAFCPNCASPMEAFEMNPLKSQAKTENLPPVATEETSPAAADKNVIAQTSVPASYETSPNVESPISADTKSFSSDGKTESFSNDFNLNDDVELEIFDSPKIEKPKTADLLEKQVAVNSAKKDYDKEIETVIPARAVSEEIETVIPAKKIKAREVETVIPARAEPKEVETVIRAKADSKEAKAATPAKAFAAGANGNGNGNGHQAKSYQNQPSSNKKYSSDDGFQVTVIQEKNAKQRNGLLLSVLVLMLTLTAGGMVYSIFNHPLLIGAIGDELMLSVPVVTDEVPMEIEEEAPKPKDDRESGGGGGGGREEETPTSKGRLATQTPEEPLITPTKTIPQRDNPESENDCHNSRQQTN